MNQWLWILAVFGFAHRYLSGRDGPMWRYLTEAIFPFYIIHQTTIEVVGHYLAKHRMPLGVEATLLIGVTIASSVLDHNSRESLTAHVRQLGGEDRVIMT